MIQPKLIIANDIDSSEIINLVKRREAFQQFVDDEVSEADNSEVYQSWSEILLNPRGEAEVMSELYNKDPDELMPDLKQIRTDISESGEAVSPEIDQDREPDFKDIVRLPPTQFTSQEKVEEFIEECSELPPLYFTQKTGEEYIYVEFPRDLSDKANDALIKYREDEMTRVQVHLRWRELWGEFLSRMEDSPKKEKFLQITNGEKNVKFDFRIATLRNRFEENDETESNLEGDSKQVDNQEMEPPHGLREAHGDGAPVNRENHKDTNPEESPDW